MSEPVLVKEQRGAVLVLRLNRPDARNAFNSDLVRETGLGIEEGERDPAVRCIVVTGTGDRAFSAGMDLRDFAAGENPGTAENQGTAAFRRLIRGEVSVPVVGAANATAVAGGFELLLGCDVVVASEDARFGLPEVKRGLFAAGGGMLLSTRIPLAVALELTLTGDLIDAHRAMACGLINEVVSADEVIGAALRLAGRIAANGPLAIEATKAVVRAAAVDFDEANRLQAEWAPKIFDSEDAKEGATAFVERREPIWKGR